MEVVKHEDLGIDISGNYKDKFILNNGEIIIVLTPAKRDGKDIDIADRMFSVREELDKHGASIDKYIQDMSKKYYGIT